MNKIEQSLTNQSTAELLRKLETQAGASRFFIFEELVLRFQDEPEIEKDLTRAILSDENRNTRFHGVTSLSQMALLALLRTGNKAAENFVAKILTAFSLEDRKHFSSLARRENLTVKKLELQPT